MKCRCKNIEDNNESVSVKVMYEVTAKEISPKNVYHRLVSSIHKDKWFELCYNVLESAGLNRTNQEQDQIKVMLWWSYLENSDLDKMKALQRKLSHKGLYTGDLLQEINPEHPVTCSLCTKKNLWNVSL